MCTCTRNGACWRNRGSKTTRAFNQEGDHPVRTSEALKIGDAWPRGEAVALRAAKAAHVR